MSKISMLIIIFIFAFSTSAYSQDKFSVSGQVKFPKREGVIYVRLLTQNEHENIKTPTAERNLMIKPDAQQLKAKKVPFQFVDVPKGTYAISCIQDLNENGEMDYIDDALGRKIPTEPSGSSAATRFLGFFAGGANWSDIKFEVDKDISGIEIELQSQ